MLVPSAAAYFLQRISERRLAVELRHLSPEHLRDVGLDRRDFGQSNIGEPDDLLLQALGLRRFAQTLSDDGQDGVSR